MNDEFRAEKHSWIQELKTKARKFREFNVEHFCLYDVTAHAYILLAERNIKQNVIKKLQFELLAI